MTLLAHSVLQQSTGHGQSGAVVGRPHGNTQDVGSNPAVTRNEKRTFGTPLQKVAQWSNRISVEDRQCKAELDL